MRSLIRRSLLIVGSTAVVALGLWGCAPMQVNSYAENVGTFQQYRTFAWGPPDTTSTGDPRLDHNRFFDERVRARVDQQLETRGFEKTATSPDLLVHYHASVTQEIDSRELDGWYPTQGEGNHSFVYDKGTLFVDLVESGTGRLVWRGWAEGSIDGVVDNQAWMETRIDEAVTKILMRLPNRL